MTESLSMKPEQESVKKCWRFSNGEWLYVPEEDAWAYGSDVMVMRFDEGDDDE